MRELSSVEMTQVAGGTRAGDIAMGLAGGWAGAVAGAAAGSLVPGFGTIAGGLVGFALGGLISVGYSLTQK